MKKYKVYYQMLMIRSTLLLVYTLGGWLSLTVMNAVSHINSGHDYFLGFARIWFITVIPGLFWYFKARSKYKVQKPAKVKAIIKGFGYNKFDIMEPQEFKRKYAIVSVDKKRYKCYEADGLSKGTSIKCLKFNHILIPEFGEVKETKYVEPDDT